MSDIAALAVQVQADAMIRTWQREIAENRQASARGKRENTAEGRDLARYHQGYADALDRCVQALRLLQDSVRE